MSDLRKILDKFTSVNDDASMNNLISYFESPDITSREIANLAFILADSGKKLKIDGLVADIPSTGGPSSLTTLLCPLYLEIYGFNVLKLGVQGRPAGGIDVLSCIPRYKINFNLEDVVNLVQKGTKYIHFLASNEFTPLDAKLFSYRKKIGKISVPNLAIASLLSKKLALGVEFVGLDVRVSKFGNFGTTFSATEQNARRFCETASILGIKSICFLSDANYPYQPFIGRGEALIALSDIFNTKANDWLENHNQYCCNIASQTANFAGLKTNVIGTNKLLKAFSDNLENQGSSIEDFNYYVHKIRNTNRVPICSNEEGFISVDLEKIRKTLVTIQSNHEPLSDDFSDPCGIIIQCNSGEYVHKGQPIYLVRCANEYENFIKSELVKSYRIDPFSINWTLQS